MKNEHIILGKVVPPEIRLECYKEARIIIETKVVSYGVTTFGLCLLLPCILWDLYHYMSNQPCGKDWGWRDSSISFPEVAEYDLPNKVIEDWDNRMTIRLEFLDWAIQKLESC